MATDTIKLRASLKGDVLTVRALIRHPMEVGRKREDGTRVPPHFITRVTCLLDDDIVIDADWGGGIARDPYLSFEVAGVAAGARVTLRWEDNLQGRDEATLAV